MIEIMIDLQGGAKAPLYEKIYEHIKREIVGGKIATGEKLPSTRRLAGNLAVSRSTVEMAYDQLLAEGYIQSQPCRGFFVCDIAQLYRLGTADMQTPAEEERESGEACEVDFSPYAIDTGSFPYNIWRKISRNVLMDDREELLLAGDGQGEYGLRSEIAGYLHQARGVNCSPSDVILGAGNEYLEILLAQLLGGERTILMENPGYPQAYRTFCNMGYQVKTVAATEQGLNVQTVRDVSPELVYIMPSHQFPLGSVMPLKARLELLAWAAEKPERYLIEDDHDSEYRYRGKPIPSLQSVDGQGKVIYLGTFSKSIAPSLRISYMVLPPQLMERYRENCGFYSTTVPRMLQDILKEFIRDGHFERHLNKMRGVYRSRHDFLLGELKKRGWVRKVSGDHAGLHVLVEVDTTLTEEELCKRARMQGVAVSGLKEYELERAKADTEVVLERTQISGEAAAKRGAGSKEGGRSGGFPVLLLGYGKLTEPEIAKGLEVLDAVCDSRHADF
ncbi:MAG: PLP-dependent aminotransferase family protein [Roseburia sp.]|nr:PLP-dependent aminotransferase family protein [Roseburia sp.]